MNRLLGDQTAYHVIQGEIQVILAVMRQSQGLSSLSNGEIALAFVDLRNNLQDHACDSHYIVRPFLDLIRSEDAPAIITSLALTSITKLVTYSLFSQAEEDCKLAESMNDTVDAICRCKFEVLDVTSEEIVLLKMQRLLLALLKSEGGALLTKESRIGMVQSCFMISRQMRLSALLRRALENILVEMVRVIFTFNDESGWQEIIEFILDPLPKTRKDDKSSGSVLLCISLCLGALEAAGNRIVKSEGIMAKLRTIFFPALVLASLEEDNIQFCVILRSVVTLITTIGSEAPLHLLYLFESLYVPYLLTTHSAKGTYRDHIRFERQELVIESLLEILMDVDMVVHLFANYDCNEERKSLIIPLLELLAKSCLISKGNSSFALRNNTIEGLRRFILHARDTEILGKPINDAVTNFRIGRERKLKVIQAVDAFNKDPIRGIEHFQSLNLIPSPATASEVANALASAPGISTDSLGGYFSEKATFHLDVLKELCRNLNFSGKSLDLAMRMLLSRFRPTGDTQQIDRILDTFAEEYFDQNKDTKLPDKDSVYTLSFALLLLNVDHHNKGVKVKMTLEQFVKNYGNITSTDGQKIQEDTLVSLYNSISAEEFTALPSNGDVLPPSNWATILKVTNVDEPFRPTNGCVVLIGDIFRLAWPSFLYSLTKVYDNIHSEDIIKSLLETMAAACDISVSLGEKKMLDRIVISLVNMINIRMKVKPTPWMIEFSASLKMHEAAKLLFRVVKLYFNEMRESWRNISYAILFLAEAGVLDLNIFVREDFFTALLNEYGAKTNVEGNSISSLFSAFSSFLSVEYSADDNGTEHDQQLEICKEVTKKCGIIELIDNSVDFTLDTLVYFLKAFMISSNTRPTPTYRKICLSILSYVSHLNVGRMDSFFMILYDHVLSLLKQDVDVVEAGLVTLFRAINDNLVYRASKGPNSIVTDSEGGEVASFAGYLKIVTELGNTMFRDLGPLIYAEICHVFREHDDRISMEDWRNIFNVVKKGIITKVDTRVVMDAMMFISSSPKIAAADVTAIVSAYSQLFKNADGNTCGEILEAMTVLHFTINNQLKFGSEGKNESWPSFSEDEIDSVLELWTMPIKFLASACKDRRHTVFDKSFISLHRALLDPHNVDIPLEGTELWFTKVMVDDLSLLYDSNWDLLLNRFQHLIPIFEMLVVGKPEENSQFVIQDTGGGVLDAPAEEKLTRTITLLSKVFLKYMEILSGASSFIKIWTQILELFIKIKTRGRNSVEIEEAIPETIRNIVLVMEASRVLEKGGLVWSESIPILDKEFPGLVKSLFPETKEDAQKESMDKHFSTQTVVLEQ